MNRLPAELIDYTIDFHHSDKQTLKVCSLVCRNWLSTSRFHLYGTVVVTLDNQHTFVELLASPSSTIACHVRALRVRTSYLGEPVFDIIAPHFEEFVALESISLESTIWTPVSETSLSSVSGRIGKMELTSVYSMPFFFRLTFTLGESGPSSFLSTLRDLHSVMHGSQPSSWLPIIVQRPSVGQVELLCIKESELPTVQAVLKSGGPFIHTIKLDFLGGTPDLSLISDCIDLTHNTNLRSLFITNLYVCNSEEIARHASFLKIIQRISSPSLTVIGIDIAIHSLMDLTWLDCEKVADELNHSRFAKLENVGVVVKCPYGIRDMVMATVLGEMDIRSILAVTTR